MASSFAGCVVLSFCASRWWVLGSSNQLSPSRQAAGAGWLVIKLDADSAGEHVGPNERRAMPLWRSTCTRWEFDDHRRERLTLDVWKHPLKARRPQCPYGCSLRSGCSWHFSSLSPHSTRGRIVAMLVGMEAHTRRPADTLPRCERMVSADRTLE